MNRSEATMVTNAKKMFWFCKGFSVFRSVLLSMAGLRDPDEDFQAGMHTPAPRTEANPTPAISILATDHAMCNVRLNFTSPDLVSALPMEHLMLDEFSRFCSHLGNVCGVPERLSFLRDNVRLYASIRFDNGTGRYLGASGSRAVDFHAQAPALNPVLDDDVLEGYYIRAEVSPKILADALLPITPGIQVWVHLDLGIIWFADDSLISTAPVIRLGRVDEDVVLPFHTASISFYGTSRDAVAELLRKMARVWICALTSGECSFLGLLPDGYGCVKVWFFCPREHSG